MARFKLSFNVPLNTKQVILETLVAANLLATASNKKTKPDPKINTISTRQSNGKVIPYSLTSVGPGADPGVQAVSL